MNKLVLALIGLSVAVVGCSFAAVLGILSLVAISNSRVVVTAPSATVAVVAFSPSATVPPASPTSPATTTRSAAAATACNPPAGWLAYRIQAGDTLGTLAQQTASSVASLQSANCLSNGNMIAAGQIIYVPRVPVPATPGGTNCAYGLPARLMIGGLAKVTPGPPNSLNSGPGTTRGSGTTVIGQLSPGVVFTIVGGPTCAEGMRWWQVNYQGLIGWTAEGQNSTYWLEPVTEVPNDCSRTVAPRLTVGQQARVPANSRGGFYREPVNNLNNLNPMIQVLEGNTVVTVLAGPKCFGAWNWWQVRIDSGAVGWMIEGNDTAYWLEPAV